MNSELTKIFVGCKRPSKIDDYIEGVKQGTKERVLSELKEKVICDLTEYGIPRKFTWDDIDDCLLGCNAQEIGEIKARLEFLDKIDRMVEKESEHKPK